MQEVKMEPREIEELATVIPKERIDRLVAQVAPDMQAELAGNGIINVNSTASGGGVAEMLRVLLPLTLGVGIPTRWLVVEGDPVFFRLTKRLHHRLHGNRGDSGELSSVERALMAGVVARGAPFLLDAVTPGDVVILHDPQPAPLAPMLAERNIPVVWRCHVGTDHDNAYTEEAWNFLRPFLENNVDQYVFTRASYAPDWVPPELLRVIKPSIDPLAPKNQDLSESDVLGAISGAGVTSGPGFGNATFKRNDRRVSSFDMQAEIVRSGEPPSADTPMVVQVSRWDPLKDMAGVLEAFAKHIAPKTDACLSLVGPSTASVSDDPEGQQVLDEVTEMWRALPHEVRDRVQLVSLPMDDQEQNGALVNAIQRHAAVVVQKSLAEGFGLTVTEAMFKGRPVVASAVGGIVDQIDDQVSGLLVADARDLREFGRAVVRVLKNPDLAERLGQAARKRAIEVFLPDTSLDVWHDVLVTALKDRR
ncbi:MAG: glycosyltransferase [Candidatus Nanopelagicales bacterium]|nr:glycosyltransferase [Candidatus Nanopelagicales bacterium]MDZ4249474.1 glycosyltransferase [Candidatus Nanopelagicales bacterium]